VGRHGLVGFDPEGFQQPANVVVCGLGHVESFRNCSKAVAAIPAGGARQPPHLPESPDTLYANAG
jgi:hypothetical protein